MPWSFDYIEDTEYGSPIMRASHPQYDVYWQFDVLAGRRETRIVDLRRVDETPAWTSDDCVECEDRGASLEDAIESLARYVCYHGIADTVVGPRGNTLVETFYHEDNVETERLLAEYGPERESQ